MDKQQQKLLVKKISSKTEGNLRYPIFLKIDKNSDEIKQEDETNKPVPENYFTNPGTSKYTQSDAEKLRGNDVFLSRKIKSDHSYSMDRVEPQSFSSEMVHYVNCSIECGKIKKTWECGICGRHFQHQYTLVRHLPTHTNIRNFKCKECGKAFRQLSTLTQHKAIHSVERPHLCLICNKTFNRMSTLISHKKIHSVAKTYICEICKKGFHQKGNLRNHIYTHTNIRPYKCSHCDQGFNQRSNLVCHIQKVHKAGFDWPCIMCDEKFMKRSDLRSHEFKAHSDALKPKKTSTIPKRNSNTLTKSSSLSLSNDTNNLIIIPAVKTSAMMLAKERNEKPSAVVHWANGKMTLVRIFDYDDKSVLKFANKYDYTDSTDRTNSPISIILVATIIQYFDGNGNSLFNILSPYKNYKFVNDNEGAKISIENTVVPVTITFSPLEDEDTVWSSAGIQTTSEVPPKRVLSPFIQNNDDEIMMTLLSPCHEFFDNCTSSIKKSPSDETSRDSYNIEEKYRNEYRNLCDEMDSFIKNIDSPIYQTDFFSEFTFPKI